MNNNDYGSYKNYSEDEINHFNKHAHEWWDEQGPLKTLHQINPVRLSWVQQHIDLKHKNVLDVGCGGGILSTSMALQGANVMGIDMAQDAIDVATMHALDIRLNSSNTASNLIYKNINIEELSNDKSYTNNFDCITCMEMLEHVPDPQSIIISCAKLLKPNGIIFFSTLNRNLKTYLKAIVGAEYILKLLPKGTHTYNKLIRPAELALWAQGCGLNPLEFKGIGYNPLAINNKHKFYLQKSIDVNYLLACIKTTDKIK
jgi:2-polyprenyl-6-hydroxyphenyl methylase / 3-demethylubiquinone-9 3-methyltransferase